MKKSSILGLGMAAVMLVPFSRIYAQTDSIVYGRATIHLDPVLLQPISTAGGSITTLAGSPLQNGAATFTIFAGSIDLKTSLGEDLTIGGFQITVNGQILRIENLIFENTPNFGPITGEITFNGKVLGRQTIFLFEHPSNGAPLPEPVPLQNGTFTETGAALRLAPTFITILNSQMGQSVVAASTTVGSADTYVVVVPETTGNSN